MKKLIENGGIPLMLVAWFVAFLLGCFIYVFVDWALWLARYLGITFPAAVVLMALCPFLIWLVIPVLRRGFVGLWELAKDIMA